MIRTWHLGGHQQSLVLASFHNQLPEAVYWGPPLPETDNLEMIANANRQDVTGGMLDQNPPLSLSPEVSKTFPGEAGHSLRDKNGNSLAPRFSFHEEENAETGVALTFKDRDLGLTLRFALEVCGRTSILKLETELKSDAPIQADWLAAPVLPVPSQTNQMIEFSGRWCSEFQTRRLPFAPGARTRDNRTGRTDHAHFPGLIAVRPGTTNTSGEAYAFHYGWSGGHKMVAEELFDGRRQVQFGHASRTGKPGTHFQSAPLYATYTSSGLNGAAVSFQRYCRTGLVTAARNPRPVHYNCWEAVYFDHNLHELKSIATKAHELGAERFVLDDGWFGHRDDDTSSLGDWVIDTRKYPDGLTPLIDHVTTLGMEFGIWFEPEMINEDSELFRAHPDWVLGPADQIRGRQQLVLDMSRNEVQDYLFARIAAVLQDNAIGYIKWDHNRVLPVADAAQAEGTYALLDRLRAAFPDVEIESCASGGGRIDYGILQRTQRVWLSDSNDALERQRIQHDAALFLPGAVTGSHVGPRTCHTSGRMLDIRIRAWTAAQRHMGFEMDPRELTDEEAGVLRKVTSWWKANRDWLMLADILRLDSSDPAIIAEQHLAKEGDRFTVFAAQIKTSEQVLPHPLRLTGLEAGETYRVKLLNREDAPGLSRGTPLLKAEDLTVGGQYLMSHGVTLPWRFPGTIWVLEGHRT
ncbi:alpha-galactosidase [Roseibium denhamense]|uniref:Alpha-galactosidase n=1 Tax=Roseibium denhamense TaxID=76305 RepID=A0ABY1NIE1_9HYPH|nr:alpha-galactosidase [Roseibium denhamense]MTI05061.1 alpha-galactosidase [Roseibium denhamense]SMP10165.1 alpha-galactosidase [Roseibium denhamense]